MPLSLSLVCKCVSVPKSPSFIAGAKRTGWPAHGSARFQEVPSSGGHVFATVHHQSVSVTTCFTCLFPLHCNLTFPLAKPDSLVLAFLHGLKVKALQSTASQPESIFTSTIQLHRRATVKILPVFILPPALIAPTTFIAIPPHLLSSSTTLCLNKKQSLVLLVKPTTV